MKRDAFLKVWMVPDLQHVLVTIMVRSQNYIRSLGFGIQLKMANVKKFGYEPIVIIRYLALKRSQFT